jgi:HAD superfamily hydrolase (TIGR01549 family)
MPYAREIIEKLDELGLKKGVVTRNCRESVNIILKRFDLKFDFVITREDAEPKPSPKPIQLALKLTKSEPSESITVGDFKFDLIAGKKAVTKTALVLTERNRCMIHEFIHLADYVLHSLKDIEKLLR